MGGETAALSRVFLGWRGAFLQQVADWLLALDEAAEGDFSRLLLVVPGRRAGRRLLEIMAQRVPARTPAFVPPAIVTLGNLPESLELESELPVAGEVDELLARVAVLRAASTAQIEVLCGGRPPEGRLEEWLDLAREIGALEDELAAEDLDLGSVRARAPLEEHDERRFETLESLGDAHQERLRRHGLLARNRSRLDSTAPSEARTVVMVGVADLGRLFRRLLSRSRVVCLVQAPPEEASAFDDWGCPREAAWAERRLDLNRSFGAATGGPLLVVDRPAEQVRAAAGFVETCCSPRLGESDGRSRYDAHEVAVGVGDPLSARAVSESLAALGLPAHSAFGRPFGRSRPARLLAALGRFVAGRRLADLAALVRHPDVERFLEDLDLSARDATAEGGVAAAVESGDWPTVLDHYLGATLARRLGPEMPEHSSRTPLVCAVGERLLALLPESRRPLAQWSAPVLDALAAIYGDLTLALDDPGEAELGEALSLLGDALREQMEGAGADDGGLVFDAAQAITFTLGRLAGASLGASGSGMGHAAAGAGEGVEILGWLELPLDDAPALVVTGLNEGVIPQSVNADPFLPDRTRRNLGLLHNRRRYARDLFHLTALVHSREELVLVAGRRSADDEPLVPSRLLLACDEKELPARIRSFFKEESPLLRDAFGDQRRDGDVPLWLGEPPPPEPLRSPVRELPVTAFRDYLACPYRFYLRHVLRLGTLRDRRRELDPGGFGSLAHEILRRFGETISSAEPEEMEAQLRRLLEIVGRERFGTAPPPAVRMQLAQLGRRLAVFASWQAEEADEGWTTERRYLEVPLRAALEVDGAPFFVSGRIDRIDVHRDGRLRLLDYKTGERRRTPEEVHRTPDGGWKDLQLPLYELLVRALGLEGRVELGFVHLSRELDGPTLTLADWSTDEVEEAWEVAREVVRKVREERFWPPSDPPPYDDGLGWICGDGVAPGEGGLR